MRAVTSQLKPRPVITWDKVERIWRNEQIWTNPESVVHRLPLHYKRRYWKNVLSDRRPVHWEPHKERYTWDKRKEIWVENEDHPIIPLYPPEADEGLWGGEGVIMAYKVGNPKIKKKSLPNLWYPKTWWPDLQKVTFYSEILNRFMLINVTTRTLKLIDEAFGFDFYILKTPEPDLHSKLGCKLKRELYLALATEDLWPNDSEKKAELLEKYKDYIIPVEEAEWIGLDLNEACQRQQDLEFITRPVPKKFLFEQETIENNKAYAYLSSLKDVLVRLGHIKEEKCLVMSHRPMEVVSEERTETLDIPQIMIEDTWYGVYDVPELWLQRAKMEKFSAKTFVDKPVSLTPKNFFGRFFSKNKD